MNQFQSFFHQSKGKRIAVIGAGISNTPLIKLLVEAGANVTVCDRKEKLDSMQDKLASYRITFQLGEDYLKNLNHEIIFRTPGMHPMHPALQEAKKQGSFITSEMELFLACCPCKVIAITGSDGKTTTTTLVYEILTRAGKRCHLGGNIGTPLLAQTEDIKPDDMVVLELSSFQLMTIDAPIDIAAITNVTPNHLDVHTDMEEYIKAKANVFKSQKAGSRLVLNADNEVSKGYTANVGVETLLFSMKNRVENGVFLEGDTIWLAQNGITQEVMKISDIRIPGMHNVENYMTATAITLGLCSLQDVKETAQTFAGVAHRIECVGKKNGVDYYNDSIASSPTRTIAGLESFDQKVILIAGGYDKNIPYEPLGIPMAEHVKALVVTGQTGPKIEKAAREGMEKTGVQFPVYVESYFAQAVLRAAEIAEDGDVVILSPASASFDEFQNFAERGDRFRELVKAL